MRIILLSAFVSQICITTAALAQLLTITPESLDFGEVSVGYPATLQFTLENTDPDSQIAVTLSPSDTVHFQLNWTGSRAEALRVMQVIGDIRDATYRFIADTGWEPVSVEQLIVREYVIIPEAVANNWVFSFFGGHPLQGIRATSTEDMPDGSGRLITFTFLTGFNSDSYGIPLGDPKEPQRVQETIGAINDAARMFRQDYGRDPGSVELLQELDYLDIQIDLNRRWRFSLIGANPTTQIRAVSTAEYIDGDGLTMVFDIESGLFSGFGIPYEEFHDWLWDNRSSVTMDFRFNPEEARDYSSVILIFLYIEGERIDTLSIPISASGTLSAPRETQNLVDAFTLLSAYPDPFNSSSMIRYQLPHDMLIDLALFDLNGRRVKNLTQGLYQSGDHSVVINGNDLASGAYIVMLRGGGVDLKRKLVLVR